MPFITACWWLLSEAPSSEGSRRVEPTTIESALKERDERSGANDDEDDDEDDDDEYKGNAEEDKDDVDDDEEEEKEEGEAADAMLGENGALWRCVETDHWCEASIDCRLNVNA